ncbi:helix-turn-helix domain-containing protein [Promicromonospora sp. NPDC050880]|uniref:helix-turn-helix domain-containing protein n=1 Tax=Promicromonospora sp. NPDC050880 TaxID=3364406 RepID=UPI0037B4D0C9
MTITWSRLHEVLGLSPGELNYDDVVAAVEKQTPEDGALDWKGERPDTEHHRVELAKDVAAMANSGGGIIVYGVSEVGSEKTLTLNDIDLADQGEQQIRSIVWQRVRPVVGGIEVLKLENSGTPGSGVLVVSVPASPDAPHFYEKNGQPPAAPWRNGPHTENLREREIEKAYRDRFTRQDVTHAALADLVAGMTRRLRFDGRAARWSAVVSRPVGTVPLGVPESSNEQVREVVREASGNERDLTEVGPTEPYRPLLSDLGNNPRRGLRRWIVRLPWNLEEDNGDTANAYAELHDDGSVVFAYPASDPAGPDAHDGKTILSADVVECLSIAAVTLTRQWQLARSIVGPTLMRAIVLADPEGTEPTWVYGRQTYGLPNQAIPAWTTPVSVFEPVDVLLDPRPGTDTNREASVELAQGILHQFGYELLDRIQTSAVDPTTRVQ